MSLASFSMAFTVALHVLVELLLVARVLLRPHRDPASRIAWVVVIVALPVIGILAYVLFGEHGPTQFRTQLREQHPVLRSRTYC